MKLGVIYADSLEMYSTNIFGRFSSWKFGKSNLDLDIRRPATTDFSRYKKAKIIIPQVFL